MKKSFFFIMDMLLFAGSVLAQPSTRIKPLSIGDTVPDIVFNNVINYKTPSVSLSDFKGRLVILDFWATWCSSCINRFPKMDSLQQAFNGKLQVVLVNNIRSTGDSEKKIRTFFQRWKGNDQDAFALPIAMKDTTSERLFPHTFLPHYVWIGPAGTVLAMTASKEVTPAHIQAALDGTLPALSVKIDHQ
jgi:thiol-disulfide isomerase/thioredoxin